MHNFTVALDAAVHAEEPRPEELPPLTLDEMAPHHDVDVAAFVLQRDEYHAARRVGTLAAGHETRGRGTRAVRQLAQLSGIEQMQLAQLSAQERERMAPERQPEARVI